MYIDSEKFNELCDELIKKIDIKKYKGVYGVPRGGVYVAIYLSCKTKLKLYSHPDKDILIVDDILDSGKTKEKFKWNDFVVLIDKQNNKINEWVEFFWEKKEIDGIDIVTRQLELIGENPNREGLKDTPLRVVKMWKELFKGYDIAQKPVLTVFENGKDGIFYDEMIIDTGEFNSTCEHHMISFIGRYYLAYIPDKKIIGLSKVARIIDYYSSKLQVQERLAKEVLDELEKLLQPKGIGLILKASHLCKQVRGIKKKGEMTTSDLRGVLKTQASTRQEFLSLIGK